MESFLQLIPRSSYNTFGWVSLVLFLIINLVIIAIEGYFETNATLQCNPDKSIASNLKYIETQCFLLYAQEFYPPLPIYALLVINLGVVSLVSIVYAYSVSYRVRKYAESSTAVEATHADEENQESLVDTLPEASDPDGFESPRVFILYTLHLIFRIIILLLVFAAVLSGGSSSYPTQFKCSWSTKATSAPSASIAQTRNHSLVYCTYPTGGNNEKMAIGAAGINLLFCTLALAEIACLLWSARKYDDFRTEMEFCCVYILRKRKRIRKLMKKIRQNISDDVFHLYDDFGERTYSRRKLDDFYVNVIIQDGRENILHVTTCDALLMSIRNANVLWEPADLFSKNRRSILVVGRPGIGKTLLTKKIFYEWKQQKLEFWKDKIVLLIRFRSFNDERISLRKMLRRSYGLKMSSKDFKDIYEYICLKSKNVILIFDGLDELNVDNLSLDKENVVNSHDEPMHILSIFKQLLNRTLLPGVTVLATSRPTAEHIYKSLDFGRHVEILGFSEEQIQEYVSKFCHNDMNKGEKIFTLIKQSAELVSLCYVPVNCYIICLTLSEAIEQTDGIFQSNVPVTITELYKRAIKILLFRHHAQYRTRQPPNGYLIAELPEPLQKDLNELKAIARHGMEEDKLIFELEGSDATHDQLSDCGLFNKLEEGKRRNFFCFLHLTIQEFLAALHVVDDMANIDGFLSAHIDNPKWHLVIQFVAGLIGDKKRELKAKCTRKAAERTDETENLIETVFKRFHDSLPHNNVNVYGESHLRVIKWIHETQDVDVSSIACDDSGVLTTECRLESLNIAPVDASALFGFLNRMTDMENLVIIDCIMEKYAVLELAKLLGKIEITELMTTDSRMRDDTNRRYGTCKLSELNLLSTRLTDEGAKCLTDALKSAKCKLTKLNLSSNELTDEGAKCLSDALRSGNCKLTELNLSTNELTDEGAKCLSDALKSDNCKLTELSLSHNQLTHEGANCLIDALKSGNCKLTTLPLRINKLTDEIAKCLSDALKNGNCKVTELNLSHNEIRCEGAKCLSDALQSGKCKLTKLNLSYNEIRDEGAKCFSDALKNGNCNLTELSLLHSKLTDEGAKCLSDALKSNKCKLTVLNLSYNQLTEKGAKCLGDALKSGNCKLTALNLSYNQLTEEGAKCLSDALGGSNCKLTELNLSYNQSTHEGGNCLIDALRSGNCKLTKLRLRTNKLTDESAKCLSDALKNGSCKLTELSLLHSKLTDEGAKRLSDALKSSNCKLSKLNLSYNELTDKGAKCLSDALKSRNCKLTALNLSYNEFTHEGAKYLNDALKSGSCKLTVSHIQ